MKPLRVTKAQAGRLERNLSGLTPRAKRDLTSDIMTLGQGAAAKVLDILEITGERRQRLLMSGDLNRHLLKASRELAMKIQRETGK